MNYPHDVPVRGGDRVTCPQSAGTADVRGG